MVPTISVIVFISQLICCIYCKKKLTKYLPTLIPTALMTAVVACQSLGIVNIAMMVALTPMILHGLLAIGIYHLVYWIKNRK